MGEGMSALDAPFGVLGWGWVGWGGLLCFGEALDADVFPAEVRWGALEHVSVTI